MSHDFYALVGRARSGKDTAAKFLIEAGIVSRSYAFAEPIKKCVNALFGWDERHADGELKEVEIEARIDPRRCVNFIQYYNAYKLDQYMDAGTAFNTVVKLFGLQTLKGGIIAGIISPRKAYQLFGTEFGRNMLSDSVWVDIAPKKNVVITDCRFPNEAAWVRKNNGKLIRVNRLEAAAVNAHPSEQHISQLDVHVDLFNNFSLEHLRTQVLKAVEK